MLSLFPGPHMFRLHHRIYTAVPTHPRHNLLRGSKERILSRPALYGLPCLLFWTQNSRPSFFVVSTIKSACSPVNPACLWLESTSLFVKPSFFHCWNPPKKITHLVPGVHPIFPGRKLVCGWETRGSSLAPHLIGNMNTHSSLAPS